MTLGALAALDDRFGAPAGSRPLARALWATPLAYTPPAGDAALRADLAARLYGEGDRLEPDEILLTHGGVEPLLLAALQLADAKTAAVVPSPAYAALVTPLRQRGVTLLRWPARRGADGRWRFALGELAALVARPAFARARTRMVVVNAPHNPTGASWAPDEVAALVGLARRTGAVVVSDEVYRGLEFDLPTPPPLACVYEHALSIGVMAKVLGMPGLRMGWVACRDRRLRERLAGGRDYTTICNEVLSQRVARSALCHLPRILAAQRGRVARNRAMFRRFLADHRRVFRGVLPPAGPMAWVDLVGGDAPNFCRQLAAGHGIILLPSCAYDDDRGNGRVRFGLGRRALGGALRALAAALAGDRRLRPRPGRRAATQQSSAAPSAVDTPTPQE